MSHLKRIKSSDIQITIFEYFIGLLLVLSANSIYMFDDVTLHMNIILIASLLSFILFLFIKKRIDLKVIKEIIAKYYKCFIIYYIYIICFIFLNKAFSKTFFSSFIIILPIFTFVYLLDNKYRESLLEKILQLIIVISCSSLIFYLLLDILKVISYTSITHINWGIDRYVPSFLGIYFNTQTTHLGRLIVPRNTGIFTEAPMYSLVLVFSLAYYEFINKNKKSNVIRIILLVTIITTFSTTGYLSVVIIYTLKLFLYFYTKIKSIKKSQKIACLILAILSAICCVSLLSYKLNTGSGSIRMDDYKACYKTWIEHGVILGAGYGNEQAIKKNMGDFRKYDKGLSNSIMVVLAEGGIMLLIVYIAPFISTLAMSIRKKRTGIICFALIIMLLFCTTSFYYLALMMSILATGYSYSIKKE